MAVTSGSVSTTPLVQKSYYRVDWSVKSQSIENNSSVITWKVYLVNNWEWYTNAVRIDYIKIGGNQVMSQTRYSNYTTSGEFLLNSGETTVTHNNDGSLSITVEIDAWFYSSSDVAGSGTFQLPSISRGTMFWGVGGSWKRCLVYWGVGGQWKQVIPYWGVSGSWKQIGG